jgi:hypothetical protein
VEPGLNLGGPSPKAKYSLATDSELSRVTERWEEPLLGEDTEPETMRLQAVGGLWPLLRRSLRESGDGGAMPDGVPFAL